MLDTSTTDLLKTGCCYAYGKVLIFFLDYDSILDLPIVYFGYFRLVTDADDEADTYDDNYEMLDD